MRGDEKEKVMHSPEREGERDWGLVRTGENDEKEGFYFPICCCSLPSLVLRSGPRPLWDCCCHCEQGAEKRRRRRKGGEGRGCCGRREVERPPDQPANQGLDIAAGQNLVKCPDTSLRSLVIQL